jgi:hypothetical protein
VIFELAATAAHRQASNIAVHVPAAETRGLSNEKAAAHTTVDLAGTL